MNNQIDSLPIVEKEAPGKIYRPPQLIEYGGLHEITLAVGMTSTMGDGGKGKDKTM